MADHEASRSPAVYPRAGNRERDRGARARGTAGLCDAGSSTLQSLVRDLPVSATGEVRCIMNWTRTISSVCLAGALVWTPSVAGAQGRGHDKAHNGDRHTGTSGHSTPHHDVAIDRDGHRRAIHEFAVAGPLPPGLAKREALPPGLRKQLHERGTLPPGLEKRLVAVPGPLGTRLPPVPGYYHRYFAGDDLLIV